MAILVNNTQAIITVDPEWVDLLEQVLQQGLISHQKPDAEVSVVLVNDQDIWKLNLEYRGVDRPTDVLSFAMEEDISGTAIILPEDAPELLGDIYISVERTIEQAKEYQHPLERELCYLAVHGLLHLLGFDHQASDDTALMRAAEEQILARFSLGRQNG
jgi:probable rRNA maturation factor